jgi:hypothetical protein
MTVTKHYEDDHVMLYVKDGETETCITLDSDRQVERLAKCLTDCGGSFERFAEWGLVRPLATTLRVSESGHKLA